jgi:hypothetical protein
LQVLQPQPSSKPTRTPKSREPTLFSTRPGALR